jgi:hypothetical protein
VVRISAQQGRGDTPAAHARPHRQRQHLGLARDQAAEDEAGDLAVLALGDQGETAAVFGEMQDLVAAPGRLERLGVRLAEGVRIGAGRRPHDHEAIGRASGGRR